MASGSYSALLSVVLLVIPTSMNSYLSLNSHDISQSIDYKERFGTQVKCQEKISADLESDSNKIYCKVNLTSENMVIYYQRENQKYEELSIKLNEIEEINNIGKYILDEDAVSITNESTNLARQYNEYNSIIIYFRNLQNAKLEKVYVSAKGKDAYKISSLLKESIDNIKNCILVSSSSQVNSIRSSEWKQVYKCND